MWTFQRILMSQFCPRYYSRGSFVLWGYQETLNDQNLKKGVQLACDGVGIQGWWPVYTWYPVDSGTQQEDSCTRPTPSRYFGLSTTQGSGRLQISLSFSYTSEMKINHTYSLCQRMLQRDTWQEHSSSSTFSRKPRQPSQISFLPRTLLA